MTALRIGEEVYLVYFDKDSIVLQKDFVILSLLFQDSWTLYAEGIKADESLAKSLEEVFKIKIEKIIYTA